MKLLVLGGTVFLGRAIVEAALQAGHEVTLFHRGNSNPHIFPSVEKIHGDRKIELTPLINRKWEAVIDTCGYLPADVRRSAGFLKNAVDHYTFISSISVYASVRQIGMDESAPLGKLADETVEEVNGDTYGPLKALCEAAAEGEMPGRALIVRPGLIVGPYDPSDRFTYWPHRVAQGGEVLVPGRPARPVQIIDVRDLAEWTLRLVEKKVTGIFNATGPDTPLSMANMLEVCKEVSQSEAHFTWVSESFLKANQVGAWIELPLWVPESDPENQGFFAVSIQKALDAGLTFRPLDETVRSTLAWDRSRGDQAVLRAGLSRPRETELLALWKDFAPAAR